MVGAHGFGVVVDWLRALRRNLSEHCLAGSIRFIITLKGGRTPFNGSPASP